MSSNETVTGCIKEEYQLTVLKQDENNDFIVQHPKGNRCIIENTYAEMFPMWLGRILITADSEKWALTAAQSATGYAASVIMSPAEAGIETGSVRLFKERMTGKALPFKPEEWPEIVKQAIGILNDNRWFPLTTWLVGIPGEDEEDVNATLELLDDLKGMKLFITPLLWVPLRPSILSEGSRPEIEALNDLQWEVFTRSWQFNLDVWRPPLKINS